MRFDRLEAGIPRQTGAGACALDAREEVTMLAAIGFGIIGTIIVIALIIAVVLWLLNRA
jgi:hypothetical protein